MIHQGYMDIKYDSSNSIKEHKFIYKIKSYQYDFRAAICCSDYIYENLDFFLHNPITCLIDNEESTNFSEESINDFISYINQPNSQIINNDNVFILQKLNKKYKIKSLQTETDDYINKHHEELLIQVINDRNNLSLEEERSIAFHLFFYIDNKQLLNLPINFIDRILQFYRKEVHKDDDEENKNEIKIMEFIFDCLDRYGRNASALFKNINFLKIGRIFLTKLLNEYHDTIDFAFIPNTVIQSLCESYIMFSPIEFVPKSGKEFEGIMHYLTDQTGGNIHDNGTIHISSNSIYDNNIKDYDPKHLVDYGNNNTYYHSQNANGCYICFDFKRYSIQLISYSMKSSYFGKNKGYHWKSWVVEVSNDNVDGSWIIVDEHVDDPTMNNPEQIAVFQNKHQRNEFYRFVRIRQTGPSWFENNSHFYIFFPFIEFFGKLRSNSF